MPARDGVVTGGTWCCDHNKLVDHWPAEDGLVEIVAEERHGGGSACNLAIDLKRLDPAFFVETIGVVGDDDDGRILLAEADFHGIERGQLRVVPGTRTNYTDAFASRATGRRTHLFFAGTNRLLTPELFDFEKTLGRLLHLGLPGMHPVMDAPWADAANGWAAVLQKARQAGLQTNMELASIAPERLADLVRPCLPFLDFLIINDVEIHALAGRTPDAGDKTDVASCIEAARAIMAEGGMGVLAVHFPGGAIALTRSGETLSKPSVRAPAGQVVGANGAGDAFAAGFLYAHLHDWPLAEALALGHASAAASLRKVGTTDGVLPWKECLDLAQNWGWRDDEA